MLRVIYNPYKGYCIPRSRNQAHEHHDTEQIHTDGFDHFHWATSDSGDDQEKTTKRRGKTTTPHLYYQQLSEEDDDKDDDDDDDEDDEDDEEDMYKDESKVALNHSPTANGNANDNNDAMMTLTGSGTTTTTTIDTAHTSSQDKLKSKKGKLTKKERKSMRKTANSKTSLTQKKSKKSKRNDDVGRNEPSNPNKVKILNRLYTQLISEISGPVDKHVKDNVKVLQFFDVSLYKEDVDNLKDDEWLSDNNISFIYEYLERFQLSQFDEHLVSKAIQLVRPSMVHLLAMIPDASDLKGIIPPIEDSKFIFLPVNDSDDLEGVGSGFHWSLVVISMLDQTAFIYDSLDRANETEARKLIGKVGEYLGGKMTFEVKVMITPQQINGSDCGMMVTQISAYLLSRLLALEYLEDHYVNFDLKNVKISAISGRIFNMGTILNLIRHKRETIASTQ